MNGTTYGGLPLNTPICYGCLVNSSWLNPVFDQPAPAYPAFSWANTYTLPEPKVGLTDEEKEVLSKLKEAWEKFVNLEGHINHDLVEFNYAIHLAQQKLALRVARRVDQEVWNQPEN